MKSEPHFWLVWCEGGGPPTVKHDNFATARAEAQRLARANPGRRFLVLMPALAVTKNDILETKFGKPSWRDEFAEEIPF
jgi:hypothetical protein